MTADELEALVLEADDGWPLQRAVAGLDEKARGKLSAPAQRLFAQLSRNKANESASNRLKAYIATRRGERWTHWNAKEQHLAALALFAVGPVSAVKKREVFVWHDSLAILDKIIRDRRPDWLDEWISHELEGEGHRLQFDVLRGWIRGGICAKPATDGYYRSFAAYLMRTGFYNRDEKVPPISAQLLADPELLDDIDGLFRVENIAFNTNSWLTKGAAGDYETWPEALIKLAAQEHASRERLLRLALEGLRLDLKQNQLSGFHKFYNRMAPTPVERLSHQQDYVGLLCHPVGHVAKFAIDMLAVIEKAGGLDTDLVVRELHGIFAGAGKGNAVAALKLLKRIIARQKATEPQAIAAVCEALRHAEAEVQALALDILEPISPRLGAEEAIALRDAEVFVSASNQARLALLLASIAGESLRVGEDRSRIADPEPAPKRREAPAAYRPISSDINDHQVLFAEDALEPIQSLDELIAAALHAVEVVDSPDDVERIVDAISRLANDRPADFTERVAPLLHRVKVGGTGANGLATGYAGVGLAVLDLLHTWLTGVLHRTPGQTSSDYYALEDAFRPVAEHLRAIAKRVARREALPPLCTPTHKGGWIDPRAWVERLGKHEGNLAQAMDFRLSLLRLAPDNRAEAFTLAQSLNAPWRRIVLFALGGDEQPVKADRGDYAAWISAARCRSPFKDWSDEFAALGLADAWPDGLRPARYEWCADFKTEQNRVHTWRVPEFTVRVTCEGPPSPSPPTPGPIARFMGAIAGPAATDWSALPTAALNRRMDAKRSWSGELSTTWVSQWLAFVWPQNPSAAHMKAATKLAMRMDENSSSWSPGFGYFRALFQRNRPWREPGHLVLCLGLAGRDADAKGLAVDALIEGIDGRLFDPAIFAGTIAGLAENDWVKFNRLGDSLMSAIPVSEMHAAVVGDALLKCLPRLDLQAKGAFRLLEVLLEAQAVGRQPLGEDVEGALRQVGGSGKSAKIARQLLAA